MSHKRKREELDSDDEEQAFGRQILPVANLPEDFNGMPEDGLQYLFTVRRDARSLPHVTRVSNPYEIPYSPQPPTTSDKGKELHPELPVAEWRALYETRFKNFRKNINQPSIHFNIPEQRRLMPDKKERELWWAFLAGKPESEWNPPKKAKKQAHNNLKRDHFGRNMRGWEDGSASGTQDHAPQNDEGEVEHALRVNPAEFLPTPTGTPTPSDAVEQTCQPSDSKATHDLLGSTRCLPREPSTTLLKLIDERMALHLLMYFTHWINQQVQESNDVSADVLTESHARWMFVLLTRIDDHISADDMSLLRNLARACMGLLKICLTRQATEERPEEVARMSKRSCWIIICTVVDVWKQRDLWMDAEDMVRTLAL